MAEVIVVGSGPAGIAAARELAPLRPLLLDVGHEAGARGLAAAPLHELRGGHPLADELVGREFEALHNLERSYLSPKLKAPLMRFITRPPVGAPAVNSAGFSAVLSYAKGGLANAWGAGVFRYDDRDLAGWPVTAAELTPFYDDLTRHIGISGAEDDLAPYFGTTADLQPPLPLSRLAARFLGAYQGRRTAMRRRGIHVGRLRSAILTQDHRGRAAHRIHNQEFFQPNLQGIYHPGYTLDELRRAGDVEYRPGVLVLRFREEADGVVVTGRDLGTGDEVEFRARHLVLAAGALNTARLALASRGDTVTRLPLLDNQLSYLPLVDPGRIGAGHEPDAFAGAELCLVYDGPLAPERVQGTFYGLQAPLRGDLFGELPLSLRGNLVALRHLVPAMGMIQLFHPDRPTAGNELQLGEGDALRVRYQRRTLGIVERHLLRQFLGAGYLGLRSLVQYPEPGSSMHYAGGLPMCTEPAGPYQCDRFGRLGGGGRVRVVDGAAFPTLPARNHTFTIMANAARIARHLREQAP